MIELLFDLLKKRCSRTKLFGNPSSFSYRRLLPYLMNITKGSCLVNTLHFLLIPFNGAKLQVCNLC